MSALPQYTTPGFMHDASPQPEASSFTHAYDVDVFVSYGHLDNQRNWVTSFHSQLQTRLQELLGTAHIVVWRDSRLDRTTEFEEVLRTTVTRSALFISVLTPRYVTSSSCREELDWFVAAAEATGGLRVEAQSRLVRVVKTRLPEAGMEPPNFKATLGYEFYESDPQNPAYFVEYGSEPGMPGFDQFCRRCDFLAQAVAPTLRRMKQMAERQSTHEKEVSCSKGPNSKGPDSRTVFLAQTTRDLEPRRASIRSELTGRGHIVLPAEPLPDSGPELRAAVQPLLAQAQISVHLIGRSYGVIPDQETRSFGELQYELAMAQRQRAGFYQLVWIPEDLQGPEERQQGFLARVHSNTSENAQGTGDVLETSFETFKEGLLDRLSRPPEQTALKPPPQAKAVYLLCDQPDLGRDQLVKIKAYLRSRGHPVALPPFHGGPEELRELEEELIGDTDAALIYYGAARDVWILRKRRNLLKVLSKKQPGRDYARALYLCTPRDDIKADYFGVPDHLYPEGPGFSPLLVLGDCEDFQPKNLDEFIKLIEKEA